MSRAVAGEPGWQAGLAGWKSMPEDHTQDKPFGKSGLRRETDWRCSRQTYQGWSNISGISGLASGLASTGRANPALVTG